MAGLPPPPPPPTPKVGDTRWCRDDVHAYLPCKVSSLTATSASVTTLTTGKSMTIPLGDLLDPIPNPAHLSLLYDDLVKMDEVHKASVVDNLRRRIEAEKIYTNVGDILIAINPYKRLPLYTPLMIDDFLKKDPTDLPPHVFGIAMDSFRSMREEDRNQSILISGESGAGKTEATKQCLHLLSEVATGEHGETERTSIENKILQANPILEAFGNAKTVRNDNSSRFGKFTQVFFDSRFTIQGSATVNYLLEKSRVVNPAKGERNFHVLYQLSTSHEKFPTLSLSPPSGYSTLTCGGETNVPNVDDRKDFEELTNALSDLGFDEATRLEMFSIVATVLHLGQVQFQESADGEGSTVQMSSVPGGRRRSSVSGQTTRKKSTVSSSDQSSGGVLQAARLLGVDLNELCECLTHRSIGQLGKANLDTAAAASARDSLAKELYGRLFNWIVLRINRETATQSSSAALKFIGILDIFGFEIFILNSFEQLCINFANEKLQQHFTSHTFDMEEQLYRTEGVPFENVAYISNQDVIDMISGKTSLFNVLDDEVVTPRGSDTGFLNKCKTRFKSHVRFGSNFKKPTTFCVKHYAGEVSYEIDGFLTKNKDRILDDLSALMKKSTIKLLSTELFSGEVDRVSEERTSTGKYKTQSRKFSDQLTGLMNMLHSTQPHYIRCIKPNPTKAPLEYLGHMVEEQLLYSGVFEATDIRKKGYPFRLSHLRFYRKYWLLAKQSVKSPSHISNWKDACQELVVALSKIPQFVEVGKCQVGNSLVLWKAPQDHILREARKEVEHTAIIIMQCMARSAHSRHLTKQLAVVRQKYNTSKQTRDLDMAIEGWDIAQKISFRNHDVKRLERLKYCLETERDLERQFEVLVTKDVTEVDEHFEKLVELGREIEMQTELFRKAEALYEQVAEKRECRDIFRRNLESSDPSESELSDALNRIHRLKEKYGAGMGVEEEPAALELLNHLLKEIKLAEKLVGTLGETQFRNRCIPDKIDTSFLDAAVNETTGHGCKKNSTRELLSLAAFASKAREAAAKAIRDCSAHDCIMEDGCNPWSDFDKVACDRDDALDLTSENAKKAQQIIEEEIDLMMSLCESFDKVVAQLKAALEEKPCCSEGILRAAILEADQFELKKRSTVRLTDKEKEHAALALKRVMQEKVLMAAVSEALEKERLGPAETLPPGTSISTNLLEAAIREANMFGISHPDDKKAVMHAQYIVRLRRTVKEVVVKFKRWRRSVGDDFVAANATIEALDGVLEERPRDMSGENEKEYIIGQDVSLRFSVVEEIVKRMDAACEAWNEEALHHHVYQSERLNLDKSENLEWRESLRKAREVLAIVEALRESLERAILNANRQELVDSLASAEDIGYDKPVVEAARDLLIKIDEIIEAASAAIWSLEREVDMLPVITRATSIGYNNSNIELLRTFIGLPLDKFLRMQLDQAEKAGDIDMMVETWCRLHDIIFESSGNTYELEFCRVLKSKDEFVGRRWDDPVPNSRMRRKMEAMLFHTIDDLRSPLTKAVKGEENVRLALVQFKNVMGYMGDRPSMYSDVFIDEVIRLALEFPDLQDETFCQLMKQLQLNPGAESRERGWHLMEVCIRKFPPSEFLSMYLENFIRKNQHEDLVAYLSTTILKLGRHRIHDEEGKDGINLKTEMLGSGSLSGWLVKKGAGSNVGKLSATNKKRFFIITSDMLSYFKTPDNTGPKDVLGATKVRNIKRCYRTNHNGGIGGDSDSDGKEVILKVAKDANLYPFVVETTAGKVTILSAES